MTYPDPDVRRFVVEHFVPLRLILNRKEDQATFRAYQVVWTPTVACLDRRGVRHYESLGYLPPSAFLGMLHIGLARTLLAWTRYDEAAIHLNAVADDQSNPLAAEALYWLGIARYLPTRSRAQLMIPWGRLLQEHPASVWALRVPPNQEDEEG